MKTYCKPAVCNVEDVDFIRPFVHCAFTGKRKKPQFQALLLRTGKITRAELEAEIADGSYNKTLDAIDAVAEWAADRIKRRDVHFKPVREFDICENGKKRHICEESAEQQVFEYICKGALDPLFKAKILPCQYGSIPGKGQVAGKQRIERILRRKLHGKVDEIQGDITKAYPSTTVAMVMRLLGRDIGKNKTLLWLLSAVMANYPNAALLIGGYLPCWLFNYVMSYVLRYLLAQAHTRRGKRIAYIQAIVCYADDFSIYGRISNLRKAMKATAQWAVQELGLHLHDAWRICHMASFEAERTQRDARRTGSRKRTPGIDMMGYVVRRTYTIIRGRDFIKLRRTFIRAGRELAALGYVPWWRAQRLTSYWGMVKYTDSRGFCEKYDAYTIFKAAKKSISWHARREVLKNGNFGAVCGQA